ncbi:hypothetical protein LF41_923 [Lysobacter dokdonensis DS-58]|uniref:Uncharacterized protein n=1 Tax=Lysobacter dokdonensis DS-58 TaxID=1300345 RepID=A0A0A2WJM9_9GAMM|nr:hypothetical protein LF41_923 [Lysobacter dokdonensis DS-58]
MGTAIVIASFPLKLLVSDSAFIWCLAIVAGLASAGAKRWVRAKDSSPPEDDAA